MNLSDILNSVDKNDLTKIDYIAKKWRQKVQEGLKELMKLSMDKGVKIAFDTKIAYPSHFKSIDISDEIYNNFLLYQNKHLFIRLLNDYETLKNLVNKLKLEEDLKQNILKSSTDTKLFIKKLNDLVPENDDFIKNIFNFKTDILGVYKPGKNDGKVEIYWSVISMLCERYNFDLEVLTLIVMSHEYAHAYTHHATDADNIKWNYRSFINSNSFIIEGLAEYFSYNFMKYNYHSYKDWETTYKTILDLSPDVYKDYKKWGDVSPEVIRYALLNARRAKEEKLNYTKFKNFISEGKTRLYSGKEGEQMELLK